MGGTNSKLPKNAGVLAASVGGNLAVGAILGQLAMPAIKKWYSKLDKPKWTPPNAVFGPVWSILYAGMGVASWMVFNKGGFADQAKPLAIYGVQLLLNFAWQPLFFNKKNLNIAAADSTLLLGSAIATTVAFKDVDKRAAWLMAPTVAWIAYATALTFAIRKRNPEAHRIQMDDDEDVGSVPMQSAAANTAPATAV